MSKLPLATNRYLVVCECTDPFMPSGINEHGIDVSESFKNTSLKPYFVLATDNSVASPYDVGGVVYTKQGEPEGLISDGVLVGTLHEGLVRAYLPPGDHKATPSQTNAGQFMDKVREYRRKQSGEGVVVPVNGVGVGRLVN